MIISDHFPLDLHLYICLWAVFHLFSSQNDYTRALDMREYSVIKRDNFY